MSKKEDDMVVGDLDTALQAALTLARRQLIAQRCVATQVVVAKIQAAIQHNGLVPKAAAATEGAEPEP